ncbi:MAG: phosphatidylglycerophosphatase A, partial [Rhodospirillaceae bacterium]
RRYLRDATSKDPGTIVIDETAGQFLALALVPLEPWWFLAGFLLFRAADIVKPWPASWADRSLAGPLGVMLDDLFAGAYALGLLFVAGLVLAEMNG